MTLLIPLAIIVLGIWYAFRIPGLRRVTADRFPEVDPAIVLEWRRLELRSIYALLLTTIGLLAIGTATVLLVLHFQFDMQDKRLLMALEQVTRITILLMLCGLIVAGNYGVQAGKLRKAHALHSRKVK